MSSDDLSPCPVCGSKLEFPTELWRSLCDSCAELTGVWVQIPDLRPPYPCLRCNHTRFVRAQLRERSSKLNSREYLAPLAVSFETWTTGSSQRVLTQRPIGIIVAYVCQQCGFTELYTFSPTQIPIGRQYGTDLVDVGPLKHGPFR